MNKINCFGDICPIPMLKLQKALVDLEVNDSVMLVVDHSCVTENIKDYYKSSKYHMLVDEVIDGVWEITLTRKT